MESKVGNAKIVIITGEPSGDFLGSQLMAALKKKNSSLGFYGLGGDLMEKEGLKSFFPFSDLAIIGIFENIKKSIRAWRRLKETAKLIQDIKPDVVVTIDFPGFNFRLARLLKKTLKHTPLIHYVAPTVWAWRSGRAKKIAPIFNHLLALFHFEPPYFKKHGLPTTFVGHPIVQMGLSVGDGDKFRNEHAILKTDTVITILPGSRESELTHHLGAFQEAVEQINKRVMGLKVVMPTLGHLASIIKDHWHTSVPTIIITDPLAKKDAYAASQVAIAASGTIALELAQAKLPMIIAYKVSWLNAWLVRRLIKIRYFCMVNILLRRSVVPELLQENCTPDNLTLEVLKILKNPHKTNQQHEAFQRIDGLLRPSGDMEPSEKAAEIVLRYLPSKKE